MTKKYAPTRDSQSHIQEIGSRRPDHCRVEPASFDLEKNGAGLGHGPKFGGISKRYEPTA